MPALRDAERRTLARTSPHAFRHAVATQTLAREAVRQSPGHASIFVSPEESHSRREAAKYHARPKQPLCIDDSRAGQTAAPRVLGRQQEMLQPCPVSGTMISVGLIVVVVRRI